MNDAIELAIHLNGGTYGVHLAYHAWRHGLPDDQEVELTGNAAGDVLCGWCRW